MIGYGPAFEELLATPLDESLLVTDFDGTLAPIVTDPAAAAGLPESLGALAELARQGLAVIVLSGRSPAYLQAHISIPGVRLLGDNGLEWPSPEEVRALGQFNATVQALLARAPGVRLVPKPASSAIHFRSAPELATTLFGEVDSLALTLGLVASLGRMVIEVRPSRGNKARAVEAVIQTLHPRCVVFAGDDEGDRDVFALLSRLDGVHIAIGIRSDETRAELFGLCDLVFDSPANYAAFLSEWTNRLPVSR
ncbi:MAG TPA: trehalose-phosphatase [Candidatus Dormibacteraeota bacterium]